MAEEPPKKPKRRAERIGKYEIVEHIASGGMGIVYKAHDPDLDRDVALKILPPDLAKQETTLIRFQREAKAAAKLRHDNIVSIYEIGEYNGAHYIALEYVEGTDLQAYIGRKCRIEPQQARDLMIQAASALVHAHEHGIVHRDIKPSNFLLTFKGKNIILKLTDFGLAIRHENEDEFRLTKDKTTVGTVDYMSPEQARDSRSADIRSDIYSLGCTFYHMLGGAAPFARGTLPERIVQHMRTPPPDVRKLNQSVPEALVAIIQRMLAKKPDERYQTPADLLHDLENLDQVEVPRKNTIMVKRGRTISRKSKADVTSVIENKDLDEASAEPAQIKLPRAKKTRVPTIIDPPSVDDLPVDEASSDEVDEQSDSVEEEASPAKAAYPRTKNPDAAGSPLWMYAAAGTVAVLALILVLAFAFGSRPPPRKEVEKKVEAPPVPAIIDKNVEPPEPMPVDVPPPMTTNNIDTSPEKMTVVAPSFRIMDLDPAKTDVVALRKDYYGSFETFPTAPEKANILQVRRLNLAGAAAYSNLAEALAQTKADQFNVIEIADNGPIYVADLPSVAKRTIVLRGAEGYRPLLVWDLPKKPAAPKAAVTFLQVAGGRLILDNLDLVMKAAAATPTTLFDLPESDFFARDCTFSVGGNSAQGVPLIRRVNPKPLGVEASKTQTWLQRCYLRGTDALLLQNTDTPAEVLLEESLVVGYQHPLLSIRAKDEDLLTLNCVRSTLVTGQVLARWQSSDGKRLNPHFQGRMLDTILSRDDTTSPQGDMLQLVDGGDTNRMQWRASNSVYAGWKQLLATTTKSISGIDLDSWHRHWAYSLSDRAIGEAWPGSPPSSLEERPAATFAAANSPFAYSALTATSVVGCVIGRLPPAPESWLERTIEPRPAPIFANIEADAPRINPAKDGMYHGERLDLNKVDLGAYLTGVLQKVPPAPRVVLHLGGKGVCNTSPVRIKGVQHLVLYFEPSLILESKAQTLKQRGPLIELTGGHLEMIGARIQMSQVTFIPTMIHVDGGHLTLSRCRLTGPLTKSENSFNSLVTVTNASSSPTVLLMRENVLMSSKLLIHAKENVQVKARNNALVSLGDGILFEASTPTDALAHVFDHNTWAVRQTFLQLRAGPDSMPTGPTAMLVNSNAFLRPFDGETERATLTRGFESWSASGRWSWQGRNNVYDARMPAFYVPGPTKVVNVKQSLKDWQQVWGQVGDQGAQVLDANLATRELSLEGSAAAFAQLDRLQLPREIRVDVTQGLPGANLFALGILKKKGT